MKLLFLLTVVLGLSPPRATRRRRVPPSRRQVRLRLQRLRSRQLPPVLVALFAASTLQWTTRTPRNQPSQSTKRVQLFHPVQNLPTASAPSAGCKPTRIRSHFWHTRRLQMPRERISTSRNRNWRPKVRRGSGRQRSSATGSFCITRISRERFRSPTSTQGSMRAGTTTITRRTTKATCAGSAAFATCYMHTKSDAGPPLRNKWPGAPAAACARGAVRPRAGSDRPHARPARSRGSPARRAQGLLDEAVFVGVAPGSCSRCRAAPDPTLPRRSRPATPHPTLPSRPVRSAGAGDRPGAQ